MADDDWVFLSWELPHISPVHRSQRGDKHIYSLLSTHLIFIPTFSAQPQHCLIVWLLSLWSKIQFFPGGHVVTFSEVTFSPWRIAVAVLTIQPAASISLFLFSCTSSLQLGSMNFSSEKCAAVCNGSKTELWKFWRLSISISHWEQTKELSWRERNFLFEM